MYIYIYEGIFPRFLKYVGSTVQLTVKNVV